MRLLSGPTPLSSESREVGCADGSKSYRWRLEVVSNYTPKDSASGVERSRASVAIHVVSSSGDHMFDGLIESEIDSESLAMAQNNPTTLELGPIGYVVDCC